MRFLIVHDRPAVAEEIRELLTEFTKNGDTIDLAEDEQSARDFLGKTIYDFLVLDLTIPYFKGKGKQPPDFGAVEKLLNELFSFATLHTPGDVIGLTHDLDALSLVQNEIGPHLMVAIKEDEAGKWKEYLKDKIRYACRAAQTRSHIINRHYDYDALILTAMDKENAPYRNIFELEDSDRFEGAKNFVFQDRSGTPRRGVNFCIGRSGQPSAASTAQSLISVFRPKLVLMSGYCGGVKDKVKFGDLVFFEAAYAWDYGKWTEETHTVMFLGKRKENVFRSRPDPISNEGSRIHRVARQFIASDVWKEPALVRRVEELSRGALNKIDEAYLKPAASGSAVVANDEIVLQLRGLSDSIIAVDMESYGVYYAATQTHVVRPEFMCVKSVSDYCNGEKGDGLHEACSYISATAVEDILTRRWDF